MPEPEVYVLLDSNVLFSASHSEKNRFLNLWNMRQVHPVTSSYAIHEVSRHMASVAQRRRLDTLLARTHLVSDDDDRWIPQGIELVSKDRPILAAAVAARVNFLITGDSNHFGPLYNTLVSRVKILTPGAFLDLFAERILPW